LMEGFQDAASQAAVTSLNQKKLLAF